MPGDRLVVAAGAAVVLEAALAIGLRERVPPLEVSLDWVMGGCGVRHHLLRFSFFQTGRCRQLNGFLCFAGGADTLPLVVSNFLSGRLCRGRDEHQGWTGRWAPVCWLSPTRQQVTKGFQCQILVAVCSVSGAYHY